MEKTELTPKQIVAELNKYIVGQSEAKKSVSIALRNRWRRKRLSEDMQDELIPKNILLISGNGEVIEPDDGVLAIGSGGNYALASARALMQNTDLSARDIAEKSLHIAADICVYTNHNVIVEEI